MFFGRTYTPVFSQKISFLLVGVLSIARVFCMADSMGSAGTPSFVPLSLPLSVSLFRKVSFVLSDYPISYVAVPFSGWFILAVVALYTASTSGSRTRMAGVGRPYTRLARASGLLLSLCSGLFLYAHMQLSLDWYLMKDLHPPLDYTILCASRIKNVKI